jgi:hypothetical protein
MTVGKMAKSIKLEVPDAQILVGLWSLPTEGAARWIRRIKESSGSALYTNAKDAKPVGPKRSHAGTAAIARLHPVTGDKPDYDHDHDDH